MKHLSDLHDFKEIALNFFKQQETIKLSNKMMKLLKRVTMIINYVHY